MPTKDFTRLLFFVFICNFAGIIGSFFTFSRLNSWYLELVKPTFNPPPWLFGPVWITLYTLMGIAAYLIWRSDSAVRVKRLALGVFIAQLILNALWSVLFFGWRNPQLALIDLLLLWIAIVATIYCFANISKPAAWLLVPYLLWVSFAGYLNFSIWWLN